MVVTRKGSHLAYAPFIYRSLSCPRVQHKHEFNSASVCFLAP